MDEQLKKTIMAKVYNESVGDGGEYNEDRYIYLDDLQNILDGVENE